MATAGTGFSFPLPATIADAITSGGATVTTAEGAALPSWLQFNPTSKSFAATAVPDGVLPIEVVVTVGQRSVSIVISERTDSAN
jgi:hypothetical protein